MVVTLVIFEWQNRNKLFLFNCVLFYYNDLYIQGSVQDEHNTKNSLISKQMT